MATYPKFHILGRGWEKAKGNKRKGDWNERGRGREDWRRRKEKREEIPGNEG